MTTQPNWHWNLSVINQAIWQLSKWEVLMNIASVRLRLISAVSFRGKEIIKLLNWSHLLNCWWHWAIRIPHHRVVTDHHSILKQGSGKCLGITRHDKWDSYSNSQQNSDTRHGDSRHSRVALWSISGPPLPPASRTDWHMRGRGRSTWPQVRAGDWSLESLVWLSVIECVVTTRASQRQRVADQWLSPRNGAGATMLWSELSQPRASPDPARPPPSASNAWIRLRWGSGSDRRCQCLHFSHNYKQ